MMKTRNDFVSNSSSCSFIISSDDNAGKMMLHNPTTLTLKELLSRFSEKLFVFSEYNVYFAANMFSRDLKACYVYSYDFAKAFLDNKLADNHKFLLPDTAETAYKQLKLVMNDRDIVFKEYNSMIYDIADSYHELYNAAYSNLIEVIYKALYYHLGDMTFAWEEVSDDYINLPNLTLPSKENKSWSKSIYANDLDEDEQAQVKEHRDRDTYYTSKGNDSEVDLVKSRIKRFEALGGKLEFKRILYNH